MTTPRASRAYLFVFALLTAVALMSGCSDVTAPQAKPCNAPKIIVHTEGAPDRCMNAF